ncbi:exported protein of unknown function [Nitrospira defluvii]|jgi:hypothetical protein|uniref:DUF5666 domain-containing protein n=1 Tax=Nitrospira defluvii TaxID=330214 RepID=D8P7K1_9BACT|nr:exported protein of unknown function [Nitrospira defluvii]
MALLLAFYLIFSAVIPAAALEDSPATTGLVIKADVLYWEEGELVVKEFSGHEERLKVTPETKIEGVVGGRLKTGDKIVAQITDDRKALSIKLQVPDGR